MTCAVYNSMRIGNRPLLSVSQAVEPVKKYSLDSVGRPRLDRHRPYDTVAFQMLVSVA